MPDFLNRLGGRISDYYNQAKALVAPDETIVPSMVSKRQNINQYVDSTQPAAPVSPLGMIAVPVDHVNHDTAMYGSRPGEQRLDLNQVGEPAQMADTKMRPLGRYAGGTPRVPQTGPYILEEGEAVVPAEENPNNVQGAPADFGGPVFSNEEGIKPRLDTEPAGEPTKLSGDAKLSADKAPLGGPAMNIDKAALPENNQVETIGQEASAKSPSMTGTTMGGKPQPLQVAPEDQTKKLAKQHEMIQQAKTEAADKGDLVGLGTALIQEKEFNKTEPMQEIMKTAATANAFPSYSGPNAGGSKAPEPGKAIDPKIAAEDEFMYKMKTYNEGIQNAKDKGTPEGDMEAGHLERAKLEFQKQHPWGSAGNHPGVLGKVGHVLGQIGNVAGEAILPNVAAAVPGSRLNREIQDQQAQEAIKQGSAEQLSAAQADKALQPTAVKPQDLLAQNKLDAENKLKELTAQEQTGQLTPEQQTQVQQQKEQLYASNPELRPKPEDQAKQPIGDQGSAQHQAQLDTIAQAAGLTPEQATAYKSAYGVKPTDSLATQQKRLDDAKATAQLDSAARDRKLAHDTADNNRADAAEAKKVERTDKDLTRSYEYQQKRLDAIRKPVDDRVNRMGNLRESLAQKTPLSDALIAPELLTVMAGGQGSGLRMNEAEISRIVHGRGHWEDIQAAVNKWKLDPSKALSITPEQRKEATDLLNIVSHRLDRKQAAISKASADLIIAPDPTTHRKTVSELQGKLDRVDSGKVRVQIPGFEPGDINEDQLEAFRKKHPDATVEE